MSGFFQDRYGVMPLVLQAVLTLSGSGALYQPSGGVEDLADEGFGAWGGPEAELGRGGLKRQAAEVEAAQGGVEGSGVFRGQADPGDLTGDGVATGQAEGGEGGVQFGDPVRGDRHFD